jgi:hypothetical protein
MFKFKAAAYLRILYGYIPQTETTNNSSNHSNFDIGGVN